MTSPAFKSQAETIKIREEMLSSLIYRSQAKVDLTPEMLSELVEKAKLSNQQHEISGLLFYDHPYFFQALEGPEESIKALFKKISQDPRHGNVVLLGHEVISDRKYPNLGIHLLDLKKLHISDISLDSYRSENNLHPINKNSINKIEKFINQFIESKYKRDLSTEITNQLEILSPQIPTSGSGIMATPPNGYSFAFQAVLDCRHKNISFVEALARGPKGEGAQEYFSSMNSEQREHFDMHSTEDAMSLASQLGISKFAVNFSPKVIFQSTHIAEKLPALLQKYGFDCNQLIIEITESDFIGNYHLAVDIISKLRANGIQLAIDDFGAGYAGLSLLAEFQPDIIKIDQALTKNIHSNGPKQSIVNAIFNCADSLAISVVAEGIEDEKDFQFMTGLGISQFQGYLFNTPEMNTYREPNW